MLETSFPKFKAIQRSIWKNSSNTGIVFHNAAPDKQYDCRPLGLCELNWKLLASMLVLNSTVARDSY